MALKSYHQSRQYAKRPLVQPALPLMPGLTRPKPVLTNTVRDVEEPASIAHQDINADSHAALDARFTAAVQVKGHEEPSSNGVSDVLPEASVGLKRNLSVGNSEGIVDQATDRSAQPDSSQKEGDRAELSASADDSPLSPHVWSESAEPRTPFQDEHDTANTPSRDSSKELASEVSVLTDTPEAGRPADTMLEQVNGQQDSDADQGKSANAEQTHQEHVPIVDEGYASNGHGHTSISSQQHDRYQDDGQVPPTDTTNGIPFISLSDHLLQLSHTKAWSDYAIVVKSKETQPFISYAHSMMLVRSPRLRKIMERQAVGTQNNTLTFSTPNPVMPHAFEAALRFFYSDAVLTAEALFPRHIASDTPQARTAILPYILSYWISGLLLGIDHVTIRASKLLSEFLDWDVLELLTKEAEALASGIDAEALESDNDWSDLVTQWKTVALAFCATKKDPLKVKLDTTSTTLLRSRFGPLEDNRGKHNPMLASMVFGSMPISAHSPTSPHVETFQDTPPISDTAISNILLNADYHDLVYFQHRLDRAWGGAGHQLMVEVVNERESRRHKLVANQAIPNKQRMASSSIWDVVGFKEVAVNGELRRERVGFLTPTNR